MAAHCSAADSDIAACACLVGPDVCCVASTLSICNKGLSGSGGSGSHTSSAAPASEPSCNATVNARSSMLGPREVLMKYAVGFIRLNSREPIMPRVLSLRGTCSVM